MTGYTYTIAQLNSDQITKQIQASAIVTALDHIDTSGDQVTFQFKADLSSGDQTILGALVSAYVYAAPVAVISTVAVSSTPPFGSKTITVNGVTKKLYARNTGLSFDVVAGANLLEYTGTFPWVKVMGIEAIGAELGDNSDFLVYDNASGTFSGTPNLLLNQFAFGINIAPDKYVRMADFDADFYAGMLMKFNYNSVSAKKIYLNLIMNEVK